MVQGGFCLWTIRLPSASQAFTIELSCGEYFRHDMLWISSFAIVLYTSVVLCGRALSSMRVLEVSGADPFLISVVSKELHIQISDVEVENLSKY